MTEEIIYVRKTDDGKSSQYINDSLDQKNKKLNFSRNLLSNSEKDFQNKYNH